MWILVRTEHIPKGWAGRAIPMNLIPVSAEESRALLVEEPTAPTLSPQEEIVAHLLVEGLSATEIAQRTHLTIRSIYRRIARLREQFGVKRNNELIAALARNGF